MKIVSTTDREFRRQFHLAVNRSSHQGQGVEAKVQRILKAVQQDGDSALVRFAKQFDRQNLRPVDFKVSRSEIQAAYRLVQDVEVRTLRRAAKRIAAFHARQRRKSWKYRQNGATLGQMVHPLETVGLYVPGGKAVYPSSVLMNAVPAKVAGVGRIVMCAPMPVTGMNPILLVAADIAGVHEVYRIGGAQAVAAMAFGTRTIPRVDKIVGPGNIYVATAKRLLFGTVGIDMVAGPSELLVLADHRADPAHVAADLLCEAEHDEEAKVYLVTTSQRLAGRVVQCLTSQVKGLSRQHILSRSVGHHAVAFVAKTMDEAVSLSNDIAPEHLSLAVKRPMDYVAKIRNAGAVFLGPYTPPAVADYVAGPNHVLPTGGTARFFSPLGVDDYVKKTNIVGYTKQELSKVKSHILRLASMEGLDAHGQSTESRFS